MDLKDIGNQIRAIRKRRGESQTKFCKTISLTEPTDIIVKRSTLACYEIGSIHIPTLTYLKILSLDPAGRSNAVN